MWMLMENPHLAQRLLLFLGRHQQFNFIVIILSDHAFGFDSKNWAITYLVA
jgi:hypothetical protein